MNLKGLGDYQLFQNWSGRPRRWGSDGDRVWFGGGVVDGLCDLIDERTAMPGNTSVIGCVPWLTSGALADRLLNAHGCCIVVDKGAKYVPAELAEAEPGVHGLRASSFSRLSGFAPAVNGGPQVIGPGSLWVDTEYVLEPVRVLGHRGRGRRDDKPLLHAKLMVIGETTYRENDSGEFAYANFTPRLVWLGSANWTVGSGNHLEVAVASADPELVRSATDFICEVIAFSEPLGSVCAGPEPNLLPQEYDNAAFAEAAGAAEWDYERDHEEGDELDDQV